MMTGASNIKRHKNIVSIIRNLITASTSIGMVSYDHMARFLLAYFHPTWDSIPMIVAATMVIREINLIYWHIIYIVGLQYTKVCSMVVHLYLLGSYETISLWFLKELDS